MIQKTRLVLISVFFLVVVANFGCFKSGTSKNGQSDKIQKHKAKVLSYIQDHYDNLDHFLDQDDKAAVEKVHQKNRERLEDWYAEHGALVAQSRSDLVNFLKTQDKEIARRSRDPERKRKVKAAVSLERQLQKAYEAELIEAIPPEKLKRWQQAKIARAVVEYMKPLALSKTQVNQIHELSAKALEQTDQSPWYSYGSSKLEKMAEGAVLTPQQRKQFSEYKEKHRIRYLAWNVY